MMRGLSSVEPPSITMYSRSPHGWSSTDRIAASRYRAWLYEGVTMLSFTREVVRVRLSLCHRGGGIIPGKPTCESARDRSVSSDLARARTYLDVPRPHEMRFPTRDRRLVLRTHRAPWRVADFRCRFYAPGESDT